MRTRTRCPCPAERDLLRLIKLFRVTAVIVHWWAISTMYCFSVLVWSTFGFGFVFSRKYNLTFGRRSPSAESCTLPSVLLLVPAESEIFTFGRPLVFIAFLHRRHVIRLLLLSDQLFGYVELMDNSRLPAETCAMLISGLRSRWKLRKDRSRQCLRGHVAERNDLQQAVECLKDRK